MSIILVSGGLDSAVALDWALRNTKEPHIPISFYYGQRHAKEQDCASRLCEHYRLPQPRHFGLSQAFAVIGGSSLTSGLVHGNPSVEAVERTESELPPTFVPGRNLIMLSLAAALGYTERVYDIVGGWNAVDYSGYPDCRRAFLDKAELALTYAFDIPIFIHSPLVWLAKDKIVKLGIEHNVPFGLTWSCYAGGNEPCGECDSCKIRAAGFAKLGIADPALANI